MSAKHMPVVAITLCLGLLAVLAPVAVGQDGADIPRRPVEDRVSGVGSVVPEDWQALSSGVYARGTPPDDLTLQAGRNQDDIFGVVTVKIIKTTLKPCLV